jgi:hypothetical protein
VPPITGLLWLAGVVLLGVRRPAGAIVAGLFITLMPALLTGFTLPFDLAHWSGTRAAEVPTILFGLGAIALARQPDGVFQNIARQNFERRERRRQRNLARTSGPAAAAAFPSAESVALTAVAPTRRDVG